MTKSAKYVWVDMEMTGLNPDEDVITEVAVIITDKNMKELSVYEATIKQDQKLVENRLRGSDFWSKNAASRDAIIENNKSGQGLEKVEKDIIKLIKKYFKDEEKPILAGNSVYFDRRYIRRYMPNFDNKLHYRILDVSSWKVVFEDRLEKKYVKPELHRALEDIRGSIGELNYYLGRVGK